MLNTNNCFDFRSVDDITALVTQELRTSLTPICGTLGLLQNGGVESTSEEGQRLLGMALSNTHRLIRLIKAIEQENTLPLTMLSQATLERLKMENDLDLAWERREFFLVYQPIISLQEQKILGFEALLRWQHPAQGLIPPNVFIPITEETGLICPLGIWILEQACQQLADWQQQSPEYAALVMSVNLSVRQLLTADLLDNVQRIINKTGIAPHCLKLEITESELIGNYQIANRTLYALRAMGVQLYIDDFGTGYSSLSRLQDLPVNALKIDRAFIKGKKWEISETIISLASKLGLDVIAEGVETGEDVEWLTRIGCQQVQGFFFSRPVDCQSAQELLKYFPHSKID
jgi:EAL domain-containing protein (putative c-di-GMP-specific phosphodiesterase class I)